MRGRSGNCRSPLQYPSYFLGIDVSTTATKVLLIDQAAGVVGVGAVEEEIVSVVLGTSGVVFNSADRPVVEPGSCTPFATPFPGSGTS